MTKEEFISKNRGQTKVCCNCGEDKPVSEYYILKYKKGFKFCARCKKCEVARRSTPDCLAYNKKYRKDRPEKFRKYEREKFRKKYNIDHIFTLKHKLRKRAYGAMKKYGVGARRPGSHIKDLGCTVEQLAKHLESQFRDGMSWENQGEWHIDHIIPLDAFDLTIREQFLKAVHYTNLQPLWKTDNLKKGAKIL